MGSRGQGHEDMLSKICRKPIWSKSADDGHDNLLGFCHVVVKSPEAEVFEATLEGRDVTVPLGSAAISLLLLEAYIGWFR